MIYIGYIGYIIYCFTTKFILE